MYKVNTYAKSNKFQRRDAAKFLDTSIKLMNWNINGTDLVLDIGCGTGDVTKEIILPKIPKFKQIFAVDISKEMITYAKENYPHEKIDYKVMDVSQFEPLPENLIEKFDHAFCFYVFHWIKNKREGIANIYQMLKPGADMFMIMGLGTDLLFIYERLTVMPKWSKYVIIAPDYHFPVKDFEKLLNDAGFSYIIKYEEMEYVWDTREAFIDSLISIDPHLKNVPEKLQEEYVNDFIRAVDDIPSFYSKEHKKHVLHYRIAQVYAKKPEY